MSDYVHAGIIGDSHDEYAEHHADASLFRVDGVTYLSVGVTLRSADPGAPGSGEARNLLLRLDGPLPVTEVPVSADPVYWDSLTWWARREVLDAVRGGYGWGDSHEPPAWFQRVTAAQ